jgi:hypothetical protein
LAKKSLFLSKRRRFAFKKIKEPVTVHFLPRKAARVAAFQAHFPARLAFKSDKTCTNMST